MTFDHSLLTSNFNVPAGAFVAETSHVSSVLVTAIEPSALALGSQPLSRSVPPKTAEPMAAVDLAMDFMSILYAVRRGGGG